MIKAVLDVSEVANQRLNCTDVEIEHSYLNLQNIELGWGCKTPMTDPGLQREQGQ